jgi:hypothetical protein
MLDGSSGISRHATSDDTGVTMRSTRIPAMTVRAAGLVTWCAAVAAAQTPSVQPTTPPTAAAAQTASANAQVVATYLTDRLKTELNLTPEQIPKVQAIATSGAAELEQLVVTHADDTSAAGDAARVKGMVSTLQSSQTASPASTA